MAKKSISRFHEKFYHEAITGDLDVMQLLQLVDDTQIELLWLPRDATSLGQR